MGKNCKEIVRIWRIIFTQNKRRDIIKSCIIDLGGISLQQKNNNRNMRGRVK